LTVLPEAALGCTVLPEAALGCTVLPEAALGCTVLPEAALAAALLAGADAEVLADLAVFLAGFVPGPTPIFGWPVPVLETVVTGWPGVREPDRKGKIA
jgi:hypothetical protein